MSALPKYSYASPPSIGKVTNRLPSMATPRPLFYHTFFDYGIQNIDEHVFPVGHEQSIDKKSESVEKPLRVLQ